MTSLSRSALAAMLAILIFGLVFTAAGFGLP
jgi:hypothetical protein